MIRRRKDSDWENKIQQNIIKILSDPFPVNFDESINLSLVFRSHDFRKKNQAINTYIQLPNLHQRGSIEISDEIISNNSDRWVEKRISTNRNVNYTGGKEHEKMVRGLANRKKTRYFRNLSNEEMNEKERQVLVRSNGSNSINFTIGRLSLGIKSLCENFKTIFQQSGFPIQLIRKVVITTTQRKLGIIL